MRVFLLGFMGCGKSNTGKELAGLLHYDFIDTDELVEKAEGKSITEIFSTKGETYFRNLEKKVLRNTLGNERTVIATGGGVPCFNKNMEWMNAHGVTVYLEAKAGFLFNRLYKEKSGRPLISSLSDIELMEYIKNLLFVRQPFYTKAQIIVDASNPDAGKLRKKILGK